MNIALILSGGTGTRMGGDIPKQYIEAAGRPIFSYCMETIFGHNKIDGVQIVADVRWQEEIRSRMEELIGNDMWSSRFRGFSLPGQNRQMSVFHGLEDIRRYGDYEDYVLVCDAARPTLSSRQITECLEGAVGHDGAMPVLPMKDTVYYSHGGQRVERLLERSAIYRGQAPEAFLLGKYYEANRRLLPDKILEINGSTEPAVMAEMDIAMIPGDESNFKITTRADLEHFQSLVQTLWMREERKDR